MVSQGFSVSPDTICLTIRDISLEWLKNILDTYCYLYCNYNFNIVRYKNSRSRFYELYFEGSSLRGCSSG